MKRLLYKITLSITLILGTTQFSHAQGPGVLIDVNSDGVNYTGFTSDKIKGSPYLNSEWTQGIVRMTDGKIYKDFELNYDQINDRVIFIGENKALQYFADPVKEFTLINKSNQSRSIRTFRNGFPNIDKSTSLSFFEILSEGKATLIKHAGKKMVEERGAGSINISKQIIEISKYYIVKNDNYIRVKKDKNLIIEVLKDRETEVRKFIAEHELTLKTDDELVKVIDFYNSL